MSVSDPIFLETAERIGHRLCRDALWAGEECNWLGWAMMPIGYGWNVAYRAHPATLYDGTAGIALFLARLYHFTRDGIVKETLCGALNRARAEAPLIEEKLRPSWFNGVGGIAYACLEIGRLLEREELIKEGLKALSGLHEVEPTNNELDVCVGSAGAIPVLIDVAQRYDKTNLLATARKHGKHLLRQATKTDEGWSWDTMPGGTQKNLLGYAHGVSGIATALLELWRVTGEKEFKEGALEAFRYERAHFNEQQGNWPDFRLTDLSTPPQPNGNFMLAWCHGAPGIGLARLRAFELSPDESVAKELQVSLQTTVNAFSQSISFGHGNYCLCHGAGGNADLLLTAADVLARPEIREAAEAVGRNGIAQYHTTDMPWPCGVNGGGETPNLMLGLAGIGYFYLRLYDSAAVPSVLMVRPEIENPTASTNAVIR